MKPHVKSVSDFRHPVYVPEPQVEIISIIPIRTDRASDLSPRGYECRVEGMIGCVYIQNERCMPMYIFLRLIELSFMRDVNLLVNTTLVYTRCKSLWRYGSRSNQLRIVSRLQLVVIDSSVV